MMCTEFIKKNTLKKSNTSRHIAPRRRSNECRASNNLSRGALTRRMGWQKIEQCQQEKTNGSWTHIHSNERRKLVVEGGWIQKRIYDIGWSDGKMCRGCTKEGTERPGLYSCPFLQESQKQVEQMGTRSNHVEGGLEMPKRFYVVSCRRKQLKDKPFESQRVGVRRAQKLEHVCQKPSRTTSPPMALCWESRAGGVRVGGQSCSLIMTRRWAQCGVLVLMYSAPSRGQR